MVLVPSVAVSSDSISGVSEGINIRDLQEKLVEAQQVIDALMMRDFCSRCEENEKVDKRLAAVLAENDELNGNLVMILKENDKLLEKIIVLNSTVDQLNTRLQNMSTDPNHAPPDVSGPPYDDVSDDVSDDVRIITSLPRRGLPIGLEFDDDDDDVTPPSEVSACFGNESPQSPPRSPTLPYCSGNNVQMSFDNVGKGGNITPRTPDTLRTPDFTAEIGHGELSSSIKTQAVEDHTLVSNPGYTLLLRTSDMHTLILLPSYPGYAYPRTPDMHTLVPRIFISSYPGYSYPHTPDMHTLVPRICIPSYPR